MSPFTYLMHVREEFRHIVWPSRARAVAHTLVVILIALIIAVIVGVLDYLLSLVVSRVLGF